MTKRTLYIKYLLCIGCMLNAYMVCGQYTWLKKNDFPNLKRDFTVGFAINNKGYMGGGWDQSSSSDFQDFWEYDPVSDSWSQLADMGCGPAANGMYFALNGKGYSAGGGPGPGLAPTQSLWQYDPVANSWTQKNNIPGPGGRWAGFGLAMNNKGYMGFGNLQQLSGPVLMDDFWEYDDVTDSWTALANFPSTGRLNPTGFSLADTIYFGTGWDGNSVTSDFWAYDRVSNKWIQKSDLPGLPRLAGTAFTWNGKGFVGSGVGDAFTAGFLQDFYVFDPTSDVWTAILDLPPTGRDGDLSFIVAGHPYVMCGNSNTGVRNDVYELVLDTVFDTINKTICQGQNYDGHLTNGTFVDTFIEANGTDSIRTLNLTVLPFLSDTIIQSICLGQVYDSYAVAGTYVDTFKASTGCDSIRTLNLTVLSLLSDTVVQSICQGQVYSGHNTSGTFIDTFKAENGCDSIRTLNLSVFNITISVSPDTLLSQGDSVELSAEGKGVVSVTWRPSLALGGTNTFSVIAKPDSSIIYHVTAASDSGCIATDSVNITVIKQPGWFAPNAFTPNGDGRNDYFKIFTVGEVQILSFKVFDRWGEMVFQQEGDGPGWNGTYKDKAEPPGIFVYLAEIQYSPVINDPQTKYLKGSFLLLR